MSGLLGHPFWKADVHCEEWEEWEIILYMYIVILFLLQRKFYALYIDLCQIKAFINSNYWTNTLNIEKQLLL